MSLLWVLVLVVLILALVGGSPQLGLVPDSYGYWPSGLVGVLLLILLIALLAGRL